MKQKKLLRALEGFTNSIPPIWLMRQAGRYLPEYRNTRSKAGGFLDLCYNSDLSTEVTLQPIRRFELDAAILFADILLVPDALGMKVWFEQGEGPRLLGLLDGFSIDNLLNPDEIHGKLSPVYQTLKNLSGELPQETTLIGFAGAPWTVATYMITGRSSKDHSEARKFMYERNKEFLRLMKIITSATIEYLSEQIKSGAEVIKIFDSWAGVLPEIQMEKYVYEPISTISRELKKRFPGIPIIVFPRGVGVGYKMFATNKLFSGLAIDSTIPPTWAKKELQANIAIQGNLDPVLLTTKGVGLKEEVLHLLEQLNRGPYIFNLGHGITPEADPETVYKMLEIIRG